MWYHIIVDIFSTERMHNMTSTEMLKSAAERNGLKQGYAAHLSGLLKKLNIWRMRYRFFMTCSGRPRANVTIFF